MRRRTRRWVLGLAGGLAAGSAGCLSAPGEDSTPTGTEPPETGEGGTDSSPTTRTDSPTETGTTETPAPSAVQFEFATLPREAGASVTVYPTDLQEWLREAARTGETVRAYATVPTVVPEPVLPTLDSVRLEDPAGEVEGWYDLEASGGTRYEYLAGASTASPPDDATVTPVSELSGERRRLAAAAIAGRTGDDARFYPETELGEWARTEFFGGYFSHEGTVYRGRELEQTDAGFFSHQCWYVLSLTPAADGDGPTLELAEIDPGVRRTVDRLRDSRNPEESMAREDPSPELVDFAERTDYLLLHPVVFTVSVG